jgi:protocatechuate 3,4-dioxygenase beta subunit
MSQAEDQGRRRFLSGLAAAGLAGASLPALSNLAFSQAPLAVTPACHDGDAATLPETEGPYFKPNSPARSILRETGMAGMPIVLTGFVVNRSCRPLSRVLVDLWQCDEAGNYDNAGMRLRGHQFTDNAGQYRFATIIPGLYPGRTRHFHFKFQSPNQPILTTQSYFPGEPRNAADRFFHPDLVMQIIRTAEAEARFDVVLAVG